MGKLNNVQRIRPEDFDSDYEQLVIQLGNILNEFMQQVVDLADDNVDFDNLDQNLIIFDVTVDAAGNMSSTNQINVGKTNPNGMSVIFAQNLTNSQVYADSQPFISYVPQGNGLVTVKHVSGLPANNKFKITAIVY